MPCAARCSRREDHQAKLYIKELTIEAARYNPCCLFVCSGEKLADLEKSR